MNIIQETPDSQKIEPQPIQHHKAHAQHLPQTRHQVVPKGNLNLNALPTQGGTEPEQRAEGPFKLQIGW